MKTPRPSRHILLAAFIAALALPVFHIPAQQKNDPKQPGKPGTGDAQTKDSVAASQDEAASPSGRAAQHRIRFTIGAGSARGLPGVIAEGNRSWMINSLVHQSQDSTAQAAIPVFTPKNVGYITNYGAIDYAYRDRWFVAAKRYGVDQEYDRGKPTMITFLAPGNTEYVNAAYEGIRLRRYRETHHTYELMYLFRLPLRGFKAGPFLAREQYKEIDDFTFGSYSLTRAASTDPGVTTWAAGGNVQSVYTMTGSHPWFRMGGTDAELLWGIAARFMLFDWLGFHYRFTPVVRVGRMATDGIQILLDSTSNGAIRNIQTIVPMHAGEEVDKGYRHSLEATVRLLCRYHVTVGVLREDLKRDYATYSGYSYTNNARVNAKTWGYGWGELSQQFTIRKTEGYVRLSASFYPEWGGRSSAKSGSASDETAGNTPERDDKSKSEFGLKKGALEKIGESDYLDAVYLGVKGDFEKSGMQFKETDDGGLLGRGFRLKRGRDVKTKKTVEILIAIDGDMSFDHGSSNLTKLALETVARIGKAMDAYPEVLAKIGGHTDSTGAKEFNRQLSFARATAVKNALVSSYKVDPARVIELKGYADDQKIVDTMAAEARNRRVEIRIVTPAGSSLIKIQ